MKLAAIQKYLRTGALGLAMLLPLTGFGKTEAAQNRESRMLMHLLSMEDSELTRLRQTVERIEAMSPEERQEMRKKLGKMQQMAPEKRQAIRERFEAIPKEQREAMRERWFSMSPQERKEWRQKLRNMSPEERAAAIKEQGFLPPHPHHKKPSHSKDGMGGTGERRGPPPHLQ